MPRLQNISKYCVSRTSGASASSNDGRIETPCSGICWTPWTNVGSGKPGRVEDGGRHVDHVVELRADLALRVDPAGPVDDRAVPRPAPVRGDLLRPLVGRVHRVRPADRVVVVGPRRAEVVDPRGHELHGLEAARAVEDDELVEAAVRRPFRGGAVVADDHVDERVVEDLQLLERVDQPPDVVVGVLHEARVDLHLAREHRLQIVRRVVPGGDLRGSRGQLRVLRDDAELLLAGQRLLAQRVPALVELALVAGPTTPAARGAGRASHRGRSRRRTACRP